MEGFLDFGLQFEEECHWVGVAISSIVGLGSRRGGIPVFVGTRVPLQNLIDYLERNYSLDEFLDSFPTVSREQAVAALESLYDALHERGTACSR